MYFSEDFNAGTLQHYTHTKTHTHTHTHTHMTGQEWLVGQVVPGGFGISKIGFCGDHKWSATTFLANRGAT